MVWPSRWPSGRDLFNIGAEGQIILGSIFAAYIGFAFDLPWFIHLPFAVLGALSEGPSGAASPVS